MDDPLLYALLLVLIALSAFFSSTETAFSSVSRIRLKHFQELGDQRAKKALDIVDRYDDALSAILIGNNIVNIASASIGTVLCTHLVGPKWGPGLSTVAMTLIVLCFGEILPKTYAKENAEKVVLQVAGILNTIMILFKPLIIMFVGLKKLVMRFFKSSDKMPTVTEEELKYIIEEIEDEGVLEQHESELIQSALEFNDITVSEILTHRVDIIGVEISDSIEDIKNILLTERFSRIPVYEKSMDNIVGIISDKDFFREYLTNQDFFIKKIIQETLFVPPKKMISELLKELQHSKSQIAIVTDQYGGTLGLITLEDILEELVGEIWDEDEDIVTEFSAISEHCYRVNGDTRMDDFLEAAAPERSVGDEHEITISGWILEQVEHIPDNGEEFLLDNMKITVLNVEEQRILEVQVEFLSEKELTVTEE